MATKYSKLRGRIIEKYGTQQKFAEAIGLTDNTLSLKMTGKVSISKADIVLWCKLLDIEKSEIPDYFFVDDV